MTADRFPYAHRSHTERFPLGPAERLLPGGTAALALLCGVNRRNVHRWRHEGLTVAQADHLAILLGHHPSAIWGDAWWTTDPPDGDGADPSPLGHTTDLIGAAA